jgi:WD40 repeat protein
MDATTANETRRPVLEAFGRVLRLETHNLAKWPELLWQQLSNELQWEADEARTPLEAELTRRTATATTAWLRRRSRLRQSGLIRVLAGHNSWVSACAVSRDATLIVSGSLDRTLRLWDVETARVLAVLSAQRRVLTCAVSPDRAFVVSGGDNGTVSVWDLASGTLTDSLQGHAREVAGCALAPDGSHLVTVGGGWPDSTLKLWTLEPLGVVKTVSDSAFHACTLSPDGALVVSPAGGGTVTAWDLSTDEERCTLRPHLNPVTACAVSPDGSSLLSASQDETLRIWDLQTGAERCTLEGHTDWVTACAFSPDGSFVLSGSLDRTLRMWDARTGRELRAFHGHRDAVTACAVSPCASFLVSASRDGSLMLWDPELAAETSAGHTSDVTACAMSPDGSFVVSASTDKTLMTWNPTTGDAGQTLRGHTRPVLACGVGPEGSFVVSGSDDETLRVWDLETGEGRTIARHKAFDCKVSPDGSFIASAGWDTIVKLFDVAAQREPRALEGHTSSVLVCAVSPDNGFVVSASRDGTARIWDVQTAEPIQILEGGVPVEDELDLLSARMGFDARAMTHLWEGQRRSIELCAVSPDRSLLIMDGCFGTVRICDSQSGRVLRIVGGGEPATACAISPDAALLVSGRKDGIVTVWNLNDGSQLATIPLRGAVTCLAFHPHRPFMAWGDNLGSLGIIELVGIEYGPLVVTAARDATRVSVRCPSCAKTVAVTEASLGCGLACPECGIRLRLNPFLIRSYGEPVAPPGGSRWQRAATAWRKSSPSG